MEVPTRPPTIDPQVPPDPFGSTLCPQMARLACSEGSKLLKETCRAEFSTSRLVLPLKILLSTRGTQGGNPPKPVDVSFTVIIPYLCISQGMPSNDTISYSFQPLKSLKETCRAEFSSSRLVLPLKILASTRGTQGETPPKPIDVSFTVIIPYLCIQVPVQVPVQAYFAPI